MRSKLLIPIFVLFFLAAAVNAFVISGQVTDTNATAINNALVEVFDASSVLINSTTTNATGQYSLEVGGPALRTVDASASGFDPASTPIFVDSNKTVNFALGPIAAVYLSGYVTDGSSPLNNVDIKVKQGGATFTETNTNAAGFYNASVLDGDSYDVTASLVNYDSETSPVSISGNTELNFTLTLTPTGCVENWTCTSWSTCSGSTQTRTCTDQNSCGTENNKPAESRSCSSGGSSGGGGYDGTYYTIDLTSSGTSLRLRKRDIVKFYFKGELHKVEITGITSSLVELLIQSDTFVASLEDDQTGKYDLNKDDIYDLKITADDISFYRTTLSFYLIDEPKQPQQTDDTPTTPLPTYTPPAPKPRKQVVIEDVVPDQQGNETVKKSGIIAKSFNFIKSIPYISYAAAGVVILLIVIVAIKLFKSEEIKEEDVSGYDKEQLRRRINRLEKQISRLKKSFN